LLPRTSVLLLMLALPAAGVAEVVVINGDQTRVQSSCEGIPASAEVWIWDDRTAPRRATGATCQDVLNSVIEETSKSAEGGILCE
jgi:hypothetical protein